MRRPIEEPINDRVVMRTTMGRRITWMVLLDRMIVWVAKEPRGKRTVQAWRERQAREQERVARIIAEQYTEGQEQQHDGAGFENAVWPA